MLYDIRGGVGGMRWPRQGLRFFSSLLVTYFAYAPSRLLFCYVLLVVRYMKELRRPVSMKWHPRII